MEALKAKFEEKRTLGARIKELADLANDEKRQWSAEDEKSWTEVNDDYNKVVGELEELEARKAKVDRAAEVAAQQGELRQSQPNPAKRDGVGSSAPVDADTLQVRAIAGWLRQANNLDATDEQRDAARQVGLRLDGNGISLRLADTRQVNGPRVWFSRNQRTAETRDQTVGTPSEGGYTFGTTFIGELERRMLAFNGPRQVARVIRTESGAPIEMPSVDDTGNSGADIDEAATVAEQAVAFGTYALNSYKHTSGAVLVSQELLEDTEINLATEINDLLGERLGRRQAAKFTTGTGTGQAQGIVTGASAGVTAASATAVAADEIKNLIHSLDPAYRGMPSVGFMMHDNVLLAVRKLKDGQNRYLWQDSIQLGTPDRLEGYPVTVNQNMASTIATGNITMLFGAFEKFYIRDVRTIRLYRLEELYRANDQTGFMAFIRSDSRVRQANAIKRFTQA